MTIASRLSGFFVVAMALILAGCGGGGSSSGGNHAQRASYSAVDTSPDTANLNVLVNGVVQAQGLTYGDSTSFKNVNAGSYDVGLRPAGDEIDAWTQAITLDASESDLIIAFGLHDFGTEFAKRLQLAAVPINRTAPNGNKSRIVVFNAFLRDPGLDTVSVDFKNPGTNPQISLSDIGFGASQTQDIDSGPQPFEFRMSGADQVLATDDLNLEPGKIYLVLLTGIESGAGAQAPEIKVIPIAAG